jgi:hypothetical protein
MNPIIIASISFLKSYPITLALIGIIVAMSGFALERATLSAKLRRLILGFLVFAGMYLVCLGSWLAYLSAL